MTTIGKVIAAGALSAMVATGMMATPASAHDGGFGPGLGFGLLGGFLIGNAIAHARPAYDYGPAYYDQQPVCTQGPLQWRWEQVCRPDAFGNLECRNVKTYFRPQYCN